MEIYFENPQDVIMDQFVATGHNGRITDYQNNFSLKGGSIFWPPFFMRVIRFTTSTSIRKQLTAFIGH